MPEAPQPPAYVYRTMRAGGVSATDEADRHVAGMNHRRIHNQSDEPPYVELRTFNERRFAG